MKEFIKKFYSNNFVYNGKEKLSKLTIMFIAILNIFIFITIGLGIDFQVKVLNSPTVTYPYKCRDVLNNNDISDFRQYFYTKEEYDDYYSPTDWEREPGESDEDYADRLQDLEDYMDSFD